MILSEKDKELERLRSLCQQLQDKNNSYKNDKKVKSYFLWFGIPALIFFLNYLVDISKERAYEIINVSFYIYLFFVVLVVGEKVYKWFKTPSSRVNNLY